MMQTFCFGLDDAREMLQHDIEVYYTKDPVVNSVRENRKKQTINWIIERMKLGAKPGGTRLLAPEYTQTFGNLYKAVAKVMRAYYSRCYLCDAPAEEVHHIRPRMLQGSEYDPCNLVCLCRECHDQVHRNLDEELVKAVERSIKIRTVKLKPAFNTNERCEK